MLELAEQCDVLSKPSVVDGTREEDAPATKEAISFLFKQVILPILKNIAMLKFVKWKIMGCITDITSQVPQLHEPHEDVVGEYTFSSY
jgi:hypothetical protein